MLAYVLMLLSMVFFLGSSKRELGVQETLKTLPKDPQRMGHKTWKKGLSNCHVQEEPDGKIPCPAKYRIPLPASCIPCLGKPCFAYLGLFSRVFWASNPCTFFKTSKGNRTFWAWNCLCNGPIGRPWPLVLWTRIFYLRTWLMTWTSTLRETWTWTF